MRNVGSNKRSNYIFSESNPYGGSKENATLYLKECVQRAAANPDCAWAVNYIKQEWTYDEDTQTYQLPEQ